MGLLDFWTPADTRAYRGIVTVREQQEAAAEPPPERPPSPDVFLAGRGPPLGPRQLVPGVDYESTIYPRGYSPAPFSFRPYTQGAPLGPYLPMPPVEGPQFMPLSPEQRGAEVPIPSAADILALPGTPLGRETPDTILTGGEAEQLTPMHNRFPLLVSPLDIPPVGAAVQRLPPPLRGPAEVGLGSLNPATLAFLPEVGAAMTGRGILGAVLGQSLGQSAERLGAPSGTATGASLLGGLTAGPGQRMPLPQLDLEAALQGGRVGAAPLGLEIPEARALAREAVPAGEPPIESAGPAPAEVPYPRPSVLKTVAQVRDDVRASLQTWEGAAAGAAGRVPPLRTAVHLVNPSALVDSPPASLVAKLGEDGARDFQANLIAHTRVIDHANYLAASVEDAVRADLARVGLRAKGGRFTSLPGAPAVGDVLEYPSRYPLSPAQRQLADDVHAELEDMNKAEKAAGVKKGEVLGEEGRYFPRHVLEFSSGDANTRGQVKQLLGMRQGFQRSRFYETMEEGLQKGVNYDSDVAALVGTRLRAGMKAIADKQLGDLVAPLGRTLAAPLREALPGEMGTMLPGLGPRVFDTDVARTLLDHFKPPYQPLGALDPVARLNRNLFSLIVTPFHVGAATTLHLPTTISVAPGAIGRGVEMILDGMILNGRLRGAYVRANARELETAIADGLPWNPNLQNLESIGRGNFISNLMAKTPLGRFNQGFSAALNAAGLEVYKALAPIGGEQPGLLGRLARRAFNFGMKVETDGQAAAALGGKLTGRVSSRSLGVSPLQAQAEGTAFMAPRFYRATFGLVADAVRGGLQGSVARQAMLGLIGSAYLVHYAVARALGQEPHLDPSDPHWLAVKVGDTWVGQGGPVLGIIKTVAKVADAPEKAAQLSLSNPLLSWARGRLSPLASLSVDLARQKSYSGQPIKTAADYVKFIAESVSPIPAQEAIQVGQSPASFAGGFAAGSLGLRVRAETAAEKLDALARQVTGKGLFDKAFDVADEQKLRADPRSQGLADQMAAARRDREDSGQRRQDLLATARDQTTQEQALDDARLGRGEMSGKEWRDAYAQRQEALANQRTGIEAALPPDQRRPLEELPPQRAALERYYSIKPGDFQDRTGKINWEAFHDARSQLLAELPAPDRAVVEQTTAHGVTPTAERFKAASRVFDTLDKIPHYRGLSVQESQHLDNFRRAVEDPRLQTALARAAGHALTTRQVALALGKRLGDQALFRAWLMLSRPALRQRLINPVYDATLAAHESELRPFYPELFGQSFEERTAQLRGRYYRANQRGQAPRLYPLGASP